METQPQPMSTVRRAASSRLQIRSSTTTPSTRHSLKCYTINARSRGNRSVSAQDQGESGSEAAAPPEDALAKRPRRRRATMKTLVDDVHKYLCFGGDDGLGVQAVQRMMQNATATASEGTRGDKFVLDKNTGTYSLMNVIPASSSPDTVSLRYLKQGDDHSAPVLTVHQRLADRPRH